MIEINNLTKKPLAIAAIHRLIKNFLKVYGRADWSVSIAIIGARRMQSLNRDYRGIDKTTDVLSFSGSPSRTFPGSFFEALPGVLLKSSQKPAGFKYLGEVLINAAEAEKISKYHDLFLEIGAPRNRRYLFDFLLVHGLLHLVGYNDHTEKGRAVMLRLGREFLNKLKRR